MGDTRLALEKPLLFCLELNGNQSTSIETVVVVDLLKIVSTRTVTVRRQMERRGDVTVVQRLQVDPTPDQAQAEATTASDAINVAHFNTTDRLLNGMMCLVDSCKHGPLSPSFNFAEVAVEVSERTGVRSLSCPSEATCAPPVPSAGPCLLWPEPLCLSYPRHHPGHGARRLPAPLLLALE